MTWARASGAIRKGGRVSKAVKGRFEGEEKDVRTPGMVLGDVGVEGCRGWRWVEGCLIQVLECLVFSDFEIFKCSHLGVDSL